MGFLSTALELPLLFYGWRMAQLCRQCPPIVNGIKVKYLCRKSVDMPTDIA